MPIPSPISSHRCRSALTAAVAALLLAACSSSASTADDGTAPTTLDASAITVTPEAAQGVLDSTTTMGSATTEPEPLDADQEAAVRAAVVAYHAAVATSFEPIDPESPALRAATTPTYFESLSGLLRSLAASGRTAVSDYEAEIIDVSALADDVARVDLCEIDRTVVYEADGTSASAAPSTEPRASFVALIRNEAGEWRVDGGGLDDSGRTCP